MYQYFTRTSNRVEPISQLEKGCWVHITQPINTASLEQFAKDLDIPIDFFLDPLDIDERSRYDKEENVKLVIINTLVLNITKDENPAIFITVPLGIILHPDYFITLSPTENPLVDMFIENKIRNANVHDDPYFILRLLEQNVIRFVNCLKKLNQKRGIVESELYDSSRNEDLKQLLSIEKSLVYIVNALSVNELLMMKMKRIDFLGIQADEEKADLFEDIIIDNSQALSMANISTTITSSTMEAYASIISNNLGLIMQRLTLITIILMVPTLVASIFGMNVPNGFENSRFGIWLVVIISLIVSGLLVWVFRKKRLF